MEGEPRERREGIVGGQWRGEEYLGLFVQEGAPGGRIRDGVGCERQPMERRNNGANRRCVSSQIE